jgi:fatty acid desaturase
MPEQNNPRKKNVTTREVQLARRLRFFGVLFRIFLVAGLLLLIAAIVLLIATDLFLVWILVLPLNLIALGFILARVEYRLHLRLHQLPNQDHSEDVN